MIKVIASDMDGTLLGDDHKIAPETQVAIKRACDAGIRFMVATGRNFRGAMDALKDTDITCDYILSSGAEVRNPQREVVKRTPIPLISARRSMRNLKNILYLLYFLQTGMITGLELRRRSRRVLSAR